MPNSPFTPGLPVAHVRLERVLPTAAWQCTSRLAPGVELFVPGGQTRRVHPHGNRSNGSGTGVEAGYSSDSSATSSMPKVNKIGSSSKKKLSMPALPTPTGDLDTVSDRRMSEAKSAAGTSFASGPSMASSAGGPSIGSASSTLGSDNPLSDPSLAQMATFLCITDSWSNWGACSVTCGVGIRTRHRQMLVNKKNELCQHLPLLQEEDSVDKNVTIATDYMGQTGPKV
ncbi:unnamed protein product [Protopolystoma xenopodis]|uniref:Spondin domain-containing protein n=1 Tax=Protopolystoma xenopodis TaxID=117903 RepID=A0A448XBS3_9PLAT|nr:unnamed protein product [Protopolystoma xenopodis]